MNFAQTFYMLSMDYFIIMKYYVAAHFNQDPEQFHHDRNVSLHTDRQFPSTAIVRELHISGLAQYMLLCLFSILLFPRLPCVTLPRSLTHSTDSCRQELSLLTGWVQLLGMGYYKHLCETLYRCWLLSLWVKTWKCSCKLQGRYEFRSVVTYQTDSQSNCILYTVNQSV